MAQAAPAQQRLPVLAIALLSAGALAYEVLLMRLLSIVQWHHFAYMVISLALLGYGVSGTFLSLVQERLQARFRLTFCTNIVLFGLSAVGCYLLAQQVPFNPETVLWDMHQPLRLLLMYLLLATPFIFAANAVALAFIAFRGHIASAYAADLLGAGLGSLGVIALLVVAPPLTALGAVGALGLMSLLVAVWELRVTSRVRWSVAAIAGALLLVWGAQQARLVFSPYKELSQTLRIAGTEIVSESSSPLGLLTVVKSGRVPLRHAPGLSLMAREGPPQQVAVFTNGAAMTVIDDGHAAPSAYDYLDQLTWALPYHLFTPRSVLVLGAGGGSDVLQARRQGVASIDAVELNPQLIDLVRNRYGAFSAHLYSQPGVRVHAAEARGFVATSPRRYDLIQLPLLDSFAAGAAGLYALNESYLYTVEALRTFIAHLNPNGFLAVSRWINLPPRDTLKLFATAVTALQRQGVAEPGKRLILIRGWQTSTLLIKNGEVTADDIAALRRFAAARAFDVCWFPGIRAAETNRYNLLDEPRFYNAARALLGPERQQFLERYKFNLNPATDDSPYFFQFFKWGSLAEILGLRGRGGMPLLEWGYLVLVATLLQAAAASMALILLPLAALRRHRVQPNGFRKRTVLVYFTAIGLAFLFIEMAFIQRFILFLHHPLYAAAVVLTGFLVFAGLGSAFARRLAAAGRHGAGVWFAVLGIAGVSALYLFLLGPLCDRLMAWPITAKIIATLVLIMPLAFCMGLPFPLALDRLGRQAPALIPWAWGVNGCASVISAVLATLLAIHFGFHMVILAALALYLVAALALQWERRSAEL
ncbi:MAG: SAM-dependent methyltransferase [Gammaproteobacteria bacterium]